MNHRNELEWVEYIRAMFPAPGTEYNPFIGDDAAIISAQDSGEYIVSTDMLVENIHFTRPQFSFGEIALRALAANLSDIAAMGGLPKYILLSLGLPETVTDANIEEFFLGLKQGCTQFGVQLTGGDLNRSPGPIIVSITITGHSCGGPFLKRNGAHEGDLLFVSGTLGDSRLGLHCLREAPPSDNSLPDDSTDITVMKDMVETLVLRHKTPVPRVSEGILLSSQKMATALIDISDGLATDLGRLAKASNVGCEVHVTRLPISEEVVKVAPVCHLDPFTLAIAGGEDYELLFTATPDRENDIMRRFDMLGTRVTRIGRMTGPDKGVVYYDKDNTVMNVEAANLHF